MKSPEFKKMIGERKSNSDGFTYEYGAAKGGYKNASRHKHLINRCRRTDKKSVKREEDRFINKTQNCE